MELSTIRILIIATGWPILVIGSIFLLGKTWIFYREVKGSLFGRLVVPTILGWLLTMYSLAIVATFYILSDVEATRVVLPVFIMWFITMVIITVITLRWNKEAAKLHKFYTDLEVQVDERTIELKKAHKKELEHEHEIQKLKNEFLFVATHELRSPVSAIKWGLDALFSEKEYIKTVPESMLRILKNVYERNDHLVTLVERLLDVARIEEGTVKVKNEAVILCEVLSEIIHELSPLAEKSNVHLQQALADTNIPIVSGDRALIKEVLLNLTNNAIKYNKPDGSVSFQWIADSKAVYVSVEDTGIGIPIAEIPHVFDKFHQVHKNHPTVVKGTGLGLYIAQALMTRMNGSIAVKSIEGKGTSFTVSFRAYSAKKSKTTPR